MKLNTIALALGLFAPTNAGLLRFGCAQLTVQRLDPLVNPGANPSPHIHQIIGGVGVFLASSIHSDLRFPDVLASLLSPSIRPSQYANQPYC